MEEEGSGCMLVRSDYEEPDEVIFLCTAKNISIRKRGRGDKIFHGTRGSPPVRSTAKYKVTPQVSRRLRSGKQERGAKRYFFTTLPEVWKINGWNYLTGLGKEMLR